MTAESLAAMTAVAAIPVVGVLAGVNAGMVLWLLVKGHRPSTDPAAFVTALRGRSPWRPLAIAGMVAIVLGLIALIPTLTAAGVIVATGGFGVETVTNFRKLVQREVTA